MAKPHRFVDPTRKQAVIYARVSSKEQEKGFLDPGAIEAAQEYAAAQVSRSQEYVDVETAKQTGRAAFGEMVAYLRAHPGTRCCWSRRLTGSTAT
jgi:DNA invertase Pin-like site-specific DNA recombinase